MTTIADKSDLRWIQEQINAIYDHLEVYATFDARPWNMYHVVLKHKDTYEGKVPDYVLKDHESITDYAKETQP